MKKDQLSLKLVNPYQLGFIYQEGTKIKKDMEEVTLLVKNVDQKPFFFAENTWYKLISDGVIVTIEKCIVKTKLHKSNFKSSPSNLNNRIVQ